MKKIIVVVFLFVSCAPAPNSDELYGEWWYISASGRTVSSQILVLSKDGRYFEERLVSDFLFQSKGAFELEGEAIGGQTLVLVPDIGITISGDTLRSRRVFDILKWTPDTLLVAINAQRIDSLSSNGRITRFEKLYLRKRNDEN